MGVYYGTNGNDYLYGSDGNDSLYGYYGDDWIDGGFADDTLSGNDGNDTLTGNLGNDYLTGRDGNDYLEGSDGNDTLLGENGNDTLFGEDTFETGGSDSIDGGTGSDTARYNLNSTQSSISKRGAVVSVNGDTLTNVEILQFSDRTINVNSLNPPNPVPTVPRISISNVSITEGNSGTTNAVFTVRLDRSSRQTVSVNYATANGTATAGSDYNATRGTLRFNPGVINQTISVGVKGDLILEPNETFRVNLSSPQNATISDSQGIATIGNDDIALPRLSINNLSVFEKDNRNNVALTVTLTGPTRQAVSVNFATANGSAVAGSDYVRTTGNVAFGISNAATQTKTIQIPILGDSLFERDETFSVNLANAVNATLGTSRGTVTLKNDDNPLVRNSLVQSLAFQSLDTTSLGESKSSIIDKSPDPSEQIFAVNDTII